MFSSAGMGVGTGRGEGWGLIPSYLYFILENRYLYMCIENWGKTFFVRLNPFHCHFAFDIIAGVKFC